MSSKGGRGSGGGGCPVYPPENSELGRDVSNRLSEVGTIRSSTPPLTDLIPYMAGEVERGDGGEGRIQGAMFAPMKAGSPLLSITPLLASFLPHLQALLAYFSMLRV